MCWLPVAAPVFLVLSQPALTVSDTVPLCEHRPRDSEDKLQLQLQKEPGGFLIQASTKNKNTWQSAGS